MGVGFDSQTATEWLCRAAAQGQPDAMYELGRIYMGEVSRTPAPVQKVIRAATAKESHAHAHYWLTRADALDQPDAPRKLRNLGRRIDAATVREAAAMRNAPDRVACEYDDVFGGASE